MLIPIAIISLLFSAFFSGVEIAFISANKLQLELEKNTAQFPSRIIAFFTKNESDFITTMLVGNNVALVVYGIVMTQIAEELGLTAFFPTPLSLLLAQTLITTLIVLITAEFLPKAIFRIFPNQILNIFSIPIWIFFVLLRPIALLMLNTSNILLKYILKQTIDEEKQVFGKMDLDNLLNNVKSSEGLNDTRVEVEMLQNALDLTDKKIRECMVPRTDIIAMDVLSSVQDLKHKFIETKLSKILIYKQNIDNVIGYVHSSDLFKQPNNVRSVLLPLPFVPESMKAMELLNQFIEENKGVALVVDEFGGTSGMITIEDVTEEIVGEIVDEHDIEEATDEKLSDTDFLLQGKSPVEAVNKKYNLQLPQSEEYESVAGLLLSYFEDIPKKDDVLEIEGYYFTITDANETTINKVKLQLLLDKN